MEFLGGTYYSRVPAKNYQAFVCRRFDRPLSSSFRSGYTLFRSKVTRKFMNENPGTTFLQLNSLIGNAWNNLPENRRSYYRLEAEENKPKNKKSTPRPCSSRLRFRLEHGRVIKSIDGLIDYVLHSKQFSIEMSFL